MLRPQIRVYVDLVGNSVTTVHDGAVIPSAQEPADGGKTEAVVLVEEVHGDLSGPGGLPVSAAAFQSLGLQSEE